VFDYIKMFYNPRHKSVRNRMLSAREVERRVLTDAAATGWITASRGDGHFTFALGGYELAMGLAYPLRWASWQIS